MEKRKMMEEGYKLTREVFDMLRKHDPLIGNACIMSCLDMMIEEFAFRKRESCLRISRYYLDKSKEYKNEGKDIEAGDRESKPLCENKAKRSRAKSTSRKVQKE